jgi:hypothetical protein
MGNSRTGSRQGWLSQTTVRFQYVNLHALAFTSSEWDHKGLERMSGMDHFFKRIIQIAM